MSIECTESWPNTVIIDQKMTVFRFSCHKKSKILPCFVASDERRPGVKVNPVMKKIDKNKRGIRLDRKVRRPAQANRDDQEF